MSKTTRRPSSSIWTPGTASWFVLDGLLAFGAMYAAFNLSPYVSTIAHEEGSAHFGQLEASLLFGALVAIGAHIFRLHDPLLQRYLGPLVARCLGATGVALGIMAFVVFAVIYSRIGRYILLQSLLYTPVLMALPRMLAWRQSDQRRRRLLFLGVGQVAQDLAEITKKSGLPFEVVAFADFDPDRIGFLAGNHVVLDATAGFVEQCRALEIDEVVSCMVGKLADDYMDDLMACMTLGVRVSDATLFAERNFLAVPVEHIRGEWFLQADLELSHPLQQMIKRGIDVAAALCGLVFSSPILLLAAVAIKLESGGPVLYSQMRVGRFNSPFRIWKLRSMCFDSEKDGPKWATREDDRISRVGRVLRRTRLDELPQFWNILCGEMSLVGPRPERPEFVEQLAKRIPFFNQRHLVKPGLTGWAQINYGYGSCTEDSVNKLKYDLYYIKHASLGLDLQILLRTVGAVMKGSR